MKQFDCQIFLLASNICLGCLANIDFAQAQITSDGTVPTNVSQSGNVLEITGGAQAGNNLFHSFEQFSLATGNTAFFNNAASISNIISRVTGGSLSTIDGLIQANSGANLILINPNGIYFGPNARLDIGGSFLGSTANSITFADGTEFSAINPQNPLLSVSVPLGLQMGQNPGTIDVQGTGNNSIGLSVNPGNTLALVGGNINLEGGVLTAESGRIELGSVSGGLVNIESVSQGWKLDYQDVFNFQDIELRSNSLVDASGINGGSIQVRGKNLSVQDESILTTDSQEIGDAGNINIIATEDVVFTNESNATSQIQEGAVGNAGNINISAKSIFVIDSELTADSRGEGNAGNINITVTENAVFANESNVESRVRGGVGNAGEINITAGSVVVTNDSELESDNRDGVGNAGVINITAKSVLVNNGSDLRVSSESQGNAGTININAETVTFDNNGDAESRVRPGGVGNGGNININTGSLFVTRGGNIRASSFGEGNAGNVNITATDEVVIDGFGLDQFGEITLSGIFSSLDSEAVGNAGSVNIRTGKLSVTNRGQLSVLAAGVGNAGTLRVNADSIVMDNQGRISAATAAGEGGNISLQSNSLLMRHNSEISATAGGTGNGGNILITGSSPADFVVLLEGSTISANAFEGRGGNIQIDTKALFVCGDCEITASSQLGVEGLVIINRLQPNTELQVINVPQKVTESEEVVALACSTTEQENQSEFIITGRGGLPPRPTEPLSNDNLVSFDSSSGSQSSPISQNPREETDTAKLPAPALGWHLNSQGVLILAAQTPSALPYSSGLTTPKCHDN